MGAAPSSASSGCRAATTAREGTFDSSALYKIIRSSRGQSGHRKGRKALSDVSP